MSGTKKEALTAVDTISLSALMGLLRQAEVSIEMARILADTTPKGSALYSSLVAASASDKLRRIAGSIEELRWFTVNFRSAFIARSVIRFAQVKKSQRTSAPKIKNRRRKS